MRTARLRFFCVLVVLLVAATGSHGQPRKVDVLGGPLAGPVMMNAPFSADAVMVVKMVFANGERLEKTNTAKYYRDSAGRSRVEHVSPTAPQSASARGVPTVIDENPSNRGGSVRILNAETREAHFNTRALLGLSMGGYGDHITVALGGRRFVDLLHADEHHRFLRLPEGWIQRESLGTRRIEGVEAVGTRVTLTVPPHTLRITDKEPLTVVDEQWAAPELGILISARHQDSRFGTIEYRVANVRRVEPPSTLFAIPTDYSIVAGSVPHGEEWVYMPLDLYRADRRLTP